MTTGINRQWVLARRPVGDDFAGALKWRQGTIPEPGPNEILIATLYISLDPANRLWMKEEPSYMPPLTLGVPMAGFIMGRVVRSNAPGFAAGDIVTAFGSWADYVSLPPDTVQKVIPVPGLPLNAGMSVLGATGWSAYFGLLDVGKPQAGETLVVSGAAGAVGSLVGQIGKIKGCHVIGIAGNRAKCDWLVNELGFDGAIDYRHENVETRLAELAPRRADGGGGVDLYFENVGGPVGQAVLRNMAHRGRVVLCGMIAQYNATGAVQGMDLTPVLMQRGQINGFLILDYFHRVGEAVTDLAAWALDGRLKFRTDIVDGLENCLNAFEKLFNGGGDHSGKLLVRVAPSAD